MNWLKTKLHLNKCSAVAEMGDCLATIDMDRRLYGCRQFLMWRAAVPLSVGAAGSPYNTV